jgi:ribosome biogenesis GTPase
MLAVAEWQELPASICLNKIDLVDIDHVRKDMAVYERLGYPVVFTSVVSDEGSAAFKGLLEGRTSLMMGSSGVGKSSLLNWLQPGLQLRTAEVSQATGSGRHTTTHLELVSLDCGGLVGDIPGVREFYLWDVEPEDVPILFREFADLLGNCQFRDCTHAHEPCCAIKEALEAGSVDPRRYASYLRLRENP